MTRRTPRAYIAAPEVEHSKDVLVVDDNDGIRRTMRFALEDAGYCVHEASDGVEALDTLRTHGTRLVVLLDLNLPRLDGWSVLRAVADTPLAKRHRFVFMTAQSDALPNALIHLLDLLGVPVIEKPCRLDRMVDAVAGLTPIRAVDARQTIVGAP